MDVIFAKTAKGRQEIETRSAALSPRVRRVLIFVDGKRNVAELHGMLQADDLQHTLGLLEEDGFISLVGVGGAEPRKLPVSAVLQPVHAFRLHPPGDDPLRLQKTRSFMLNALNAFAGTLGTSALQERIGNARTHADLRRVFEEWYHALVSSRDGRREAEQLRSKLLELI